MRLRIVLRSATSRLMSSQRSVTGSPITASERAPAERRTTSTERSRLPMRLSAMRLAPALTPTFGCWLHSWIVPAYGGATACGRPCMSVGLGSVQYSHHAVTVNVGIVVGAADQMLADVSMTAVSR